MLGGIGALAGPCIPDMPDIPGTLLLPNGTPLTALFGCGSELKLNDPGGPPVVGYCFPGGTFSVLRHPGAVTRIPNTTTNVPPVRNRLSRSIDMTSTFPGARHPPAPWQL
jgi:hypothetical protein